MKNITTTLFIFLLFIIPFYGYSQIGQTLSFDGTDDRVEITHDGLLSSLDQLTIEVWARVSEYGVDHTVYRGTSNFTTEAYKIGIKNGEPEFRMQGGVTSDYILEATTVFNLNEWYHIAASYDGNTARIYVNGVLENTAFFGANVVNTPGGQLIIGIDRDGQNNYNQAHDGCLDEVRIWNTVRSQQQIQNNMFTPLMGNETGLIAYYDMEQSGNQLLDQTNNQYDGLLLGSSGANNTPQFSDSEIVLSSPVMSYSICEGETVSFDISGATDYEWTPLDLVSNSSIPNPISDPLFQSTTFTAIGTKDCSGLDTIILFVEVNPTSSTSLNLEVCPGETISYMGQTLADGDFEEFILESIGGCDSMVSVSVFQSPPLLNLTTSPLPLDCGETLLLTANNNFTNIQWSDGSTESSLLISSPGTYWVSGETNGGCILTDTIQIFSQGNININLGNDTTLCPSAVLELGTIIPGATFTWQDGSTASSYQITEPGVYSVFVDLQGCTATDTIVVSYATAINFDLSPDTTLCPNNTITVGQQFPNATYQWQDNSTTTFYEIQESGTYWVNIQSDDICYQSDTILVDYFQEDTLELGEDLAICWYNDSIILDANFENAVSYIWQNGTMDPMITVYSADIGPSTYSVTVSSENNCIHTDTILIGIYPPPNVNLGPDSLICPNDTIILTTEDDPAFPNINYTWQDGSTNSYLSAFEEGIYWIQAFDDNTSCYSIIDSVNITFGEIQTFLLGSDTTLCPGEELSVGQEFPNATYSWQDDSTLPFYLINQNGNYWVNIQSEEICFVSDTIMVDYFQEEILNLGNDTTLCQGQNLILNPNYNNASYTWQDGSDNNIFTIESQGIYSVEVLTENNCYHFDEISVFYIDPLSFDLGPDSSFCIGDTVIIGQSIPGASYLWQDGSIDSFYITTNPGLYTLTLNHEECEGIVIDSLQLSYVDLLQPDLGNDTTICENESILLSSFQVGVDYLWQDSSSAPVFTAREAGRYSVVATYMGCQLSDSIFINTIDCKICNSYIPNAFSPNFDGVNDYFTVYTNCTFENFNLKIFDRWGEVVFESFDVQDGWDGTFKGKEVLNGVYTYLITYTHSEGTDQTKKAISGDLSVIK